MLGLLFSVLFWLCGIAVISVVLPKATKLEKISSGWIVGLVISSWLSFFLIWLLGYTAGVLAAALLLLVLVYVAGKKLSLQVNKLTKLTITIFPVNWPLTIFLVFWLLMLGIFFFHHSARIEPTGWYTAGNSYGDLALHTTYINYFAQQREFSLRSPVYAAHHIEYPFLINFHSSLLVRLGWSLQTTLLVIGTLTSVSTIALLYGFTQKFSRGLAVPWVASLLYFFNGGIGSIYAIQDFLRSDQTFINFFRNVSMDYTHITELGIHWTNQFTSHQLPQRGFMIGLAIVMLVMYLWQHVWFKNNTRLLVIISIIIGFTPFFHSHSYLVLIPLHGWFLFWKGLKKQLPLSQAIGLFMLPLVIGLTQIEFLKPDHSTEPFLHVSVAWMAEKENLILFWLRNMGIHFILLLTAPVVILLSESKQKEFLKLLIAPALGIFFISNVLSFQPNTWDNMKFFMLGFFFSSILSGAALEKVWKAGFPIFVIGLVGIGTVTGILAAVYELQLNYVMATTEQVNSARQITQVTKKDAIFLTSDAHNHPVPMLAGRPTLLGYRGWLWTHGINYHPIEADVKEMYAGSEYTAELLDKYKIKYVYISEWEKNAMTVNEEYFSNTYPVIWSDEDETVYQVSRN